MSSPELIKLLAAIIEEIEIRLMITERVENERINNTDTCRLRPYHIGRSGDNLDSAGREEGKGAECESK